MSALVTPILMYHHIEGQTRGTGAAPLHPQSYLPLDELRRQLDWITAGGFETLTLAQVLKTHLGACALALPRRRVVLTFDDGCRCFVRHALPELEARGMCATLFAVSAETGGENRWDSALGERRETLASAEELRRASRAGVEVASHGRTHADLTTVTDEALRQELEGSRRELEEILDTPVQTFAYPYGHLDPRVKAQVRSCGYLGAVSIHGKPYGDFKDPYALPRMIVRPGESRIELNLKLRGLYRAWSRLPRLGLLQALRRRGTSAS